VEGKCLRKCVILSGSATHLDVDIGRLALNWVPMPNHTSIENGLQYQIRCLDVDQIAIWNLGTWQIPNKCLDVRLVELN
jgi:hypothetical protein